MSHLLFVVVRAYAVAQVSKLEMRFFTIIFLHPLDTNIPSDVEMGQTPSAEQIEIEELKKECARKDKELAKKDKELEEKDKKIEEKDEEIAKNSEISAENKRLKTTIKKMKKNQNKFA